MLSLCKDSMVRCRFGRRDFSDVHESSSQNTDAASRVPRATLQIHHIGHVFDLVLLRVRPLARSMIDLVELETARLGQRIGTILSNLPRANSRRGS